MTFFKPHRKHSPSSKAKLAQYRGELASGWKGGKPKCPDCNKEIAYKSTHCNVHKVKYWTKEHRKKIRTNTSKTLTGIMPKNMQRPGKFGNVSRGWFDINGKRIFFRSTWEANYALYLDFLVAKKQIKEWFYEADVFIFEKIQTGTRSYRPDFKLVKNDGAVEYHELKGWMTPKSKTQLKRMAKYYPKVVLHLIEKTEYGALVSSVGKMLKFY